MRIKTIEDLEANLPTKVFYITELPDKLADFKQDPDLYNLRSFCRIYPCTMEKRIDLDVAGFRMNDEGNSGKSFECKSSVTYEFAAITSRKQGEKLKIDSKYFEDEDGMFEYSRSTTTWTGISTHIDVVTWDGEFEKYYTVNSLESKNEYQDEHGGCPNGMVFINQIHAFTEACEALEHVKRTAKRIADEMIEEINKQSELEKGRYYNFIYNIEHGRLY